MSRNKLVIILLSIIVISTILVFYFNRAGREESAQDKERVVIQAGWLLNGEFANVCSAIVNGYYDDVGLDVELRPGGPTGSSFIIATNTLAQDEGVDIAIDGDVVPLLRGITKENENEKLRAKIFATFWDDNPLGFIVRSDSGITSIKDFTKRKPDGSKYKIGVSADSVMPQAISAYLGVPEEKLEIVIVGYDATSFLAGQVDVLQAYWTTQAYEVEQAGIAYNFIPAKEIPGFSQPSMVALATDRTLHQKPEMLRKWLKATIEGSKFNLLDPKRSAEQILDERCGGKQFDVDQEEWLIKKSLILFDKNQIGAIDVNQISNFAQTYHQLGQIPFVPLTDSYIDQSIMNLIYRK